MHCAWPGSAANVLAAQAAQTVLFVGEHSPPLAVADGCARAARPHAAPLAAAAPQDPRVMAKQWQGALRQRVFQYFAKQRVLGRIR